MSLSTSADRRNAAGGATPVFALSGPDADRKSPFARIGGKVSRFVARNIATKTLAMRNDRPLVTFTFDDAPVSACATGAALLQQHQARGTFYICGGGCGLMSPGGPLATAGLLRELYTAGHEIGCHTFSHAAVAAVTRNALVAELEHNRRFLQKIHPDLVVRNFAYPYGDLSFRAKYCLETRFDSCRSLRPGVNAGLVDLGALKSCELQDASIGRQGIRDIIAATVRRNGWLIFVSHDVDDQPSQFGISPDLLEFALSTARVAECRLVSVHGALAVLSGAASRQSH